MEPGFVDEPAGVLFEGAGEEGLFVVLTGLTMATWLEPGFVTAIMLFVAATLEISTYSLGEMLLGSLTET